MRAKQATIDALLRATVLLAVLSQTIWTVTEKNYKDYDSATKYEFAEIIGVKNAEDTSKTDRYFCTDFPHCEPYSDIKKKETWIKLEENQGTFRARDNFDTASNDYKKDSKMRFLDVEYVCVDGNSGSGSGCDDPEKNPLTDAGKNLWQLASSISNE